MRDRTSAPVESVAQQRLCRWGAAILLCAFFIFAMTSATAKSPTVDEGAKLAMGYSYLRAGDLRFQARHNHPRLGEAWIALPLMLDPRVPEPSDVAGWDEPAGFYEYVANFFYRSPDIIRYTLAGRVQVILLGVLLGALVFRWATDWFGCRAGLLACFLYAVSPGMLAHTRLMTNDVPVALGCLATMYMAHRLLLRPGVWRALAVGLLLGVSLLIKYSAFFLVPTLVALLLAAACSRNSRWSMFPCLSRRSALLRAVGLLAVAMVAAGVVVWAGFGFELRFLRSAKLPFPVPAASVIDDVVRLGELGRGGPAFLLGHRWEGKRWYYTLATVLFKVPLPALILSACAVFVALRRRTIVDQAPLWAFPALYLAAVCFTGGTTAYRYLLPIVPFALVLSAQMVQVSELGIGRTWVTTVGGALLVSYMTASLLIYPDYLSFFNVLAGGPANGFHVLVGSNVDWGQDLVQLRRYAERSGVDEVWLSHFSLTDPALYGVKHRGLPDWENKQIEPDFHYVNPDPGVYAIGATLLQGVYLPNVSTFDWFLRRSPDADVGHSMFVYWVSEDPRPPSWLGVCYAPDAPMTEAEIEEAFGRDDLRLVYFDCRTSWIIPAGEPDGWYLVPASAEEESDLPAQWLAGADVVFEQRAFGGGREFTVYRPAGVPQALSEASTWVFVTSDGLVPDAEMSNASRLASPVLLEDSAALYGYTTEGGRLVPGGRLTVETIWVVHGPVTESLPSVLAHLTHTSGDVWGVADGLGFPAVQWQEGDRMVQQHTFELPTTMPAGTYWVATGLYDTITGHRMAVRQGNADADTLWIGPFQVE